jgi:hypothetical protein
MVLLLRQPLPTVKSPTTHETWGFQQAQEVYNNRVDPPFFPGNGHSKRDDLIRIIRLGGDSTPFRFEDEVDLLPGLCVVSNGI